MIKPGAINQMGLTVILSNFAQDEHQKINDQIHNLTWPKLALCYANFLNSLKMLYPFLCYLSCLNHREIKDKTKASQRH